MTKQVKETPNLKLVLVYGEDQATLELPLGGESLYKIDYTTSYFGIPAHSDLAAVLHDHILGQLTGEINPPRNRRLFQACLSLAEAIRDRKAKL